MNSRSDAHAEMETSFNSDGFALVRSVFTRESIAEWATIAQSVLTSEAKTTEEHPYHGVIFSIHQLSHRFSEFAGLIASEELGSMASVLLRSPIRILLDQLIQKPAGGRETIPHQDAPFLPLGDQPTVNCWMPLSDVDETNGALVYYAGSHLLPLLPLVHLDGSAQQLNPEALGFEPCTLRMRAGDCVFHDGKTIHGAAPNSSSNNRLAISIQYMQDGAIAFEPVHPFMKLQGVAPGLPMSQECFRKPRLLRRSESD